MAKLIEITGKAISGEWGADDESGTGVPVLRTTNFTNHGDVDFSNVVTRDLGKKDLSDKFLRHGDIIIEKSGGSDNQPVGRVIYFDGAENTFLFNNFTGLLRVKDQDQWFPRYVFYALFANYRQGGTKPFENRTTGLHNLQTESYVSRTEIRENAYKTQREICATLDKLKFIIAQRQHQLFTLDTLIKARFIEMFGNERNTVEMSDVCSIITDGTHQPPKFINEGIPFIFVSNLTGNTVTFDTEKFIDQSTYDELIKRTPIEIGDILLSTVGSYGHPAVVKSDKIFLFQRHIAYLKPRKELVDSDYLHAAILSPDAQRQIENGVKGIAQKTLNLSEIKRIKIPVPDMSRQKQFSMFVAQIDRVKSAVQQALTKSQQLFDSLMQQYFS